MNLPVLPRNAPDIEIGQVTFDLVKNTTLMPRMRPPRRYAAGATILEAGSTDVVGFLAQGTVKLVKVLPDGRNSIVGFIEAPGFFGKILGMRGDFVVEAAGDVLVQTVQRDQFEAHLAQDSAFKEVVHLHVARQLEEAHARILVLACSGTMQRMATYLVLRLMGYEMEHPEAGEKLIQISLGRRDLAAYLGTTVETVSRNIQALARRGTLSIVDSSNFLVLRRQDLFRLTRHDEEDLVDLVGRV